MPPFKRDSNRFKRLLGVFEKLRWKLSRFIYIGGSFVLLCVQVRCAGAGACRTPFVVCRSPAPVQQSGPSLDLEPELVSLVSYLLCVLRCVADKAPY